MTTRIFAASATSRDCAASVTFATSQLRDFATTPRRAAAAASRGVGGVARRRRRRAASAVSVGLLGLGLGFLGFTV